MNTYNADSIKILSDIEHIQQRYGMYIGENFHPGHLFSESLDNALDEVQNGYSDKVLVEVDTTTNLYSITDYGRGIPHGIKILPDGREMSVIESIACVSKSGGKFDNDNFKIRSGLNGLGLTIINALSSELYITSNRDGKYESYTFHDGVCTDKSLGDTESHNGTTIKFIPNPIYFQNKEIPINFIIKRCEVANSLGMPIYLNIDGNPHILTQSIYDLIQTNEDDTIYTKTKFVVKDKSTGEYLEIAMMYTSDESWSYTGYTNLLPNPSGGTHYTIMNEAIDKAISSYGIEGIQYKDYFLGLKLVIAAFISDPSFSSQTKEKLTVDKKLLEKFIPMISKEICKWLDNDPKIRDGIFQRMKDHRSQLNKFLERKDISKLIVMNNSKDGTIKRKSVSTKLIECTSTSREGTELILAEGDSAVGSFLPVRDRRTQALLPLRGKVLNVSKLSDILSALQNSEILDITNSIGAGLLDMCDPEKSRYDKIIISCFTGDTKIKCLDGNSYSFKELVDNDIKELWTYSCNPDGTIIPSKAINPRITKIATQLCLITLDNGEVIKCTPDHRFMLRDGTYCEAKDLTNGTSLMPGYFSTNSKGYLNIWDNNYQKYINIHTMVNNYYNKDKKDKLKIPKEYYGKYKIKVTHHKDFNKLNNTPENLEWMTWIDHRRLHNLHYDMTLGKWVRSNKGRLQSKENMTNYNKSEAHKKVVAEVGKITGPNNLRNYNLSEEHKSRIRELHSLGVYNESKKSGLVKFNKSESHRKSVCDMNRNPDIKLKQQRGRIANVISNLIYNGLEFNEMNYNSYKSKAATYDRILEYFDSYEQAYEYGINRNHKVVSNELINITEEVYDITVPEYHNFLLDAGVFVHNCDADDDGLHISALLIGMMVNLYPALVKAGMLYLITPPLYTWNDKDGYHFSNDMHEIPDGVKWSRLKGLGEMDPEEVRVALLDPETRYIYRVDYPDDLAYMNACLTSASARRKLLEDMNLIKYES